MENKSVLKKLRNLFEFFIVCCIIGWVYESVWWMMVELNYGFVNRGFLVGPWLPIYGTGMLIIYFIFKKFKIKTPGKIFIFGTIFATAFELVGSYVVEWITGSRLWSYNKFFLNFEGRIALKPDLYFGLLILFGLYCVKPSLEKFQKRFDRSIVHNVVTSVVATVFFTDVVYSVIKLFVK